jgi:PKHD-type hydroxylase
MIVCIPNVLSPEQLAAVTQRLESAPFVDGRATASEHAQMVKKNLQLDERDPKHAELSKSVMSCVLANPLFQAAVWPKVLLPFRFSRYEPGMGYGPHVDDPLAQGARSDVSMTLFLSDPESYDGGELVIEVGGVEREFKLAAGEMVTYPATTLHHVETVTRGVRMAAVSWSQSYVRDPSKRELIFELDMARRSLFRRHGKTAEFDSISNSLANLVRMWSDA